MKTDIQGIYQCPTCEEFFTSTGYMARSIFTPGHGEEIFHFCGLTCVCEYMKKNNFKKQSGYGFR